MNDDRKDYEAALERVRVLAQWLTEHSDGAVRAHGVEGLRLVEEYKRLVPTDPTDAAQWYATETSVLETKAEEIEFDFPDAPPE